ncbi:MAG: FkbM family methyltransferase [Solirubrobacterales bacterium]|nr:FkbM family methyltransferase [Solirubrobacterales bacterium]
MTAHDRARSRQDAVAKALVAVHGQLNAHPRIHRLLISIYTRLIGEKRTNREVLPLARPGDCIWDIGANVGFYTRQFLDRVGPDGHVVAIEPVPEHVDELRSLAPADRLSIVAGALAREEGTMSFVVDGQASHLGEAPGALSVRVMRGDSLLDEGVPAPSLVKIDVEGFEGEVLDGLTTTLRSARAVVVEMHFAALTRRGLRHEPMRILALLRDRGFSVRWLDSSHLLASR